MTRYRSTMSEILANIRESAVAPLVDFDFTLDEAIDDKSKGKIFDKLKKNDTINIKFDSSMSKGSDYREFKVTAKNVVGKGKSFEQEKITLQPTNKTGGVKYFLYNKDGRVSFAIGDMAAVVVDMKEGTWALPDNPKAQAELKKLMSKPIPANKASNMLYHLIGNDSLADDIGDMEDNNPKADVRPLIKKHMKLLGIKEDFEEEVEVDLDERNYAKEYANYQGTPEQIARRSSRNQARRVMGDAAVKGMDVGHKDNNPMNNDPDNLRMEDPSENRREPRLRGEEKSSTGYELYHKDFSTAMQHAYAFAKKKFGIEVDPQEIDDKVASGPRKPSSGKTNSYRLVGVDGKKAIQVQVANLDNKRYELNMYKESVDLEEADDDGPCWKGYKQVGMKEKDGKQVPNCVPMSNEELKEAEPTNDAAKEVEAGREDKKKTRIAQLQLQIAKASETINKLNNQEKSNG